MNNLLIFKLSFGKPGAGNLVAPQQFLVSQGNKSYSPLPHHQTSSGTGMSETLITIMIMCGCGCISGMHQTASQS